MLQQDVRRAVRAALAEDLGETLTDFTDAPPADSGASLTLGLMADARAELDPGADLTARLIPAERVASARVITREAGVFCGQPWVDEVFLQLNAAHAAQGGHGAVQVEWQVQDGEQSAANQKLITCLDNNTRVLEECRDELRFSRLERNKT